MQLQLKPALHSIERQHWVTSVGGRVQRRTEDVEIRETRRENKADLISLTSPHTVGDSVRDG